MIKYRGYESMKMGVNRDYKRSEYNKLAYYDRFYDIIETKTLKTGDAPIFLGIKSDNRKCRFCGKGKPDVTFENEAHALSECIGNKVLLSHYECDTCNALFGEGKGIESEYGKYFNFYHTIAAIKGKKHIPKVKTHDGTYNEHGFNPKLEAYWDTSDLNNPKLMAIFEKDSLNVTFLSDSILLEAPIQRCSPIAVYKAIVKMAITVMPPTEINMFKKTTEWIRDTEHSNIFHPQKLLARCLFIPGFDVTKCPHFTLYRRKRTIWDKPYMLFHLTYGLFSMLIEVPRDNDRLHNDIRSILFPPIIFHYSSEKCFDLSSTELESDRKHSIVLNYGNQENITEKVSASYDDKGKRKITVSS